MEMIFILFLSALITVYPLKKIDDYMFEKKLKEPKNRFLSFLLRALAIIFALSWFIFSCYLAVKIYKLLEVLISSI